MVSIPIDFQSLGQTIGSAQAVGGDVRLTRMNVILVNLTVASGLI